MAVGVAGRSVRELVKVDHFVEADDQAGETSQPDEAGQQLEGVIDVGVIDDGADP